MLLLGTIIMKIYDCITYFNEKTLFELRLNILNRFIHRFIVVGVYSWVFGGIWNVAQLGVDWWIVFYSAVRNRKADILVLFGGMVVFA